MIKPIEESIPAGAVGSINLEAFGGNGWASAITEYRSGRLLFKVFHELPTHPEGWRLIGRSLAVAYLKVEGVGHVYLEQIRVVKEVLESYFEIQPDTIIVAPNGDMSKQQIAMLQTRALGICHDVFPKTQTFSVPVEDVGNPELDKSLVLFTGESIEVSILLGRSVEMKMRPNFERSLNLTEFCIVSIEFKELVDFANAVFICRCVAGFMRDYLGLAFQYNSIRVTDINNCLHTHFKNMQEQYLKVRVLPYVDEWKSFGNAFGTYLAMCTCKSTSFSLRSGKYLSQVSFEASAVSVELILSTSVIAEELYHALLDKSLTIQINQSGTISLSKFLDHFSEAYDPPYSNLVDGSLKNFHNSCTATRNYYAHGGTRERPKRLLDQEVNLAATLIHYYLLSLGAVAIGLPYEKYCELCKNKIYKAINNYKTDVQDGMYSHPASEFFSSD